MAKLLDTIYLSPKEFARFDVQLQQIEHQNLMVRDHMDIEDLPENLTSAPKNYQAYKIYYSSGKKNSFLRDLRKLWNGFPNALSRHWK